MVLPAVLEHVEDVVSEGVSVLLQDASRVIKNLRHTDGLLVNYLAVPSNSASLT